MKKNFSDYIVALGVLLCSLVLLAALTIALAGWHPQKKGHTIEVDYPDVTGIRLHSQVRYAGAPAGSVVKIRLLNDEERTATNWSAVRVTVQFFDGVQPLPNDVRASLSSDTLLGEKFVALSAGSPTAEKLTDGTVLLGASSGSIDSLIETLGPLVESLTPMLQSVEKTLQGLDVVVGKAGVAVDAFKDGIGDTLPRVSKLADGLKTTADAATQAVQKIDKLVGDVDDPVKEDLKKLQSALAQIQQTLATADKMLGKTDKNLDARMQELGVVLQNLKVATTNAKSLTKTLAEKPNRLLFSGKPPPLPSEDEILRSSKPVPVR